MTRDAAPATQRHEPLLPLAPWIALLVLLERAGVVLALELAHHGDPDLAGLRLAGSLTPALPGALLLALVAVGLQAASTRWMGASASRFLVPGPLFALVFLFLWGRFDPDPSRRIGGSTGLGALALASAALASLGTVALVSAQALRGARLWLARARGSVVTPVALMLGLSVYLRIAHGSVGDELLVTRFEDELLAGDWEILEAHPEEAPHAGILCPSPSYSPEGAARPSLLVPPPARVRRTLERFEGVRWLAGAAGIDERVSEVAAERFPGQAVRLRVRVDDAVVFEASLPLGSSPSWHGFAGGAGLAVSGGSVVELESALLDEHGNEVNPEIPLPAGFSELRLERREHVPRARSSPTQPNLVLVLIDTLRADRTSAYGYARPTTPNLEALARRGVLWSEAHATASWTWPSTASILTGLYPSQHGVEDARTSFLPERLDTLAEALQRVGFTTAAWSGSPLIVPDKRFDQGFEFFESSRGGRLRRSDIVLPGALQWLDSVRDRRFFLYLHLMEPHAPYVPLEPGRARFAPDVPREFDPGSPVGYGWALQREGFDARGEPRTDAVVPPEEQRWISALYDACVWSADVYLGQLLARLDELGLTESTVVAVTSDHGEELFDHGLLTHGHGLHRELVRVPLVLAGPGIPRGARIETPLSNAALAPTLARLGGAEIEDLGPRPAAGADLLRPEEDVDTLFSTRQGWWNGYARQPLFGLRRGTLVLHMAPEGAPWGAANPGPGEVRMYDLAADPEERDDLARSHPERAKALREALLAQLARLEHDREESGAPPDEGTLEVLQGLGYIGPSR